MAERFTTILKISPACSQYLANRYGSPLSLSRSNPLTDVIRVHLCTPPPNMKMSNPTYEYVETEVSIPWFNDKDPRVYTHIYTSSMEVINEYVYNCMLMLDFETYMISHFQLGLDNFAMLINAYLEERGLEEVLTYEGLRKRYYRLRQRFKSGEKKFSMKK